MRLIRWKLVAGVLGLSMCGLAALAEPACRSTAPAQARMPEEPVAPAKGAKEPAPLIEPVMAILPLPELPVISRHTEVPAVLPPSLPFAELPTPSIPAMPVLKPAVTLPPSALKATPSTIPELPPAVPMPVDQLPMPPQSFIDLARQNMNITPVASQRDGSLSVLILPTPMYTPLPPDTGPLPQPQPPILGRIDTGVLPAPVAPMQLTSRTVEDATELRPISTEKKLRVQLNLGIGKPWLEIRDGEDLVLKVQCDGVEVKATGEGTDGMSTLRATGHVSFRTLGGNGTCETLSVTPGTGEVQVSGQVTVTSNWGKSETTATAEKMTFRLGTEPKPPRK